MSEQVKLTGLLVDTWWYGLSKRLSEESFVALADLRVEQGFNSVQLVVGLPPEIGPLNENGASDRGFPWTIEGAFNQEYLDLARQRIQLLNDRGLTVLVYGAWGHQLDWIGVDNMVTWWEKIVGVTDDLQVIYCLTGESNLWFRQLNHLLPDRTTSALIANRPILNLLRSPRIQELLERWSTLIDRPTKHLATRKKGWGTVLDKLAGITEKPLILHTNSSEFSVDAVENSQLLAAVTMQTGHSEDTRDLLWQYPIESAARWPAKPYINLEPWYEGITGNFFVEDQLFAYWSSMLAGAASFCYGAHGIWNVGDGAFLAHWGKQTFDQASSLDTPRLLGLSHRELMRRALQGTTRVTTKEGKLVSISLIGQDHSVHYYPEVRRVESIIPGDTWLPLRGEFVSRPPVSGQVVQFSAE